jgi:hypothetical protein
MKPSIFLLALLLTTFSSPLAKARPYQPPKVGQYRSPTTLGTRYRPTRKVGQHKSPTIPQGTRGTCETLDSTRNLTAIAPLSHIGQTSRTNPTFVWFIPDQSPHKITFRLLEVVSDKKSLKVWEKEIDSQAGFMGLTLPTEMALRPNQQYRWQVLLQCDPSSPAKNRLIVTPIIYQPSPKAIANHSPEQQIADFATADYWYDALAMAITTPKLYRPLLEDLVEIETEAIKDPTQSETERMVLTEQLESLTQILTQILQTSQPVTDQQKP